MKTAGFQKKKPCTLAEIDASSQEHIVLSFKLEDRHRRDVISHVAYKMIKHLNEKNIKHGNYNIT